MKNRFLVFTLFVASTALAVNFKLLPKQSIIPIGTVFAEGARNGECGEEGCPPMMKATSSGYVSTYFEGPICDKRAVNLSVDINNDSVSDFIVRESGPGGHRIASYLSSDTSYSPVYSGLANFYTSFVTNSGLETTTVRTPCLLISADFNNDGFNDILAISPNNQVGRSRTKPARSDVILSLGDGAGKFQESKYWTLDGNIHSTAVGSNSDGSHLLVFAGRTGRIGTLQDYGAGGIYILKLSPTLEIQSFTSRDSASDNARLGELDLTLTKYRSMERHEEVIPGSLALEDVDGDGILDIRYESMRSGSITRASTDKFNKKQ